MTASEPVRFIPHTVADGFVRGYQVVIHDMNGDRRPDLIALDSRSEELVWFANPGWERHVISGGMSRMINMTVCDGHIVVAQGFSNDPSESEGEIVVINPDGSKRVIDYIPASHRLRCADIHGTGKGVVINAPLAGIKAREPDFRDHVPLVYYRPGDWRREMIGEQNEGVMHGIHVHDWNGDGAEDILTASFSGIHVFSYDHGWDRSEIAPGSPAAWPESGSSDVAVGEADGRFVASNEPWHGNQVVVYRDGERRVIDDTLEQGHTIATADLNGDGRDEIIAGDRGETGQSVYLYYYGENGWRRVVLDDGDMAASSCEVADLNADNRPDIACIGRTTHNLKWYENTGHRH